MHGSSSCLGYLIDAYANAVAVADADLSNPTDSDDESDTSILVPRVAERSWLTETERAQLASTKCTHIVDSILSPTVSSLSSRTILSTPPDDRSTLPSTLLYL
jgi:hypothetical protein